MAGIVLVDAVVMVDFRLVDSSVMRWATRGGIKRRGFVSRCIQMPRLVLERGRASSSIAEAVLAAIREGSKNWEGSMVNGVSLRFLRLK